MTPYLGCRNLSVQFYDRKQPVLTDLSLTIEQGECVLFLGASGCGKSTLAHVLSGVIPRSIQAMTKGDVWRPDRTGIVFQDPNTQFCMIKVADEIAFSLENRNIPPHDMPARIQHSKAQVGLDTLDDDTDIHTLSGGLKQRLAIATVLALEPDVLFLDEPTAQLDPYATEQILHVIRQLKDEHTIVLIEHKLDGIMDWVDRVVLFSPEGHIIDDGSPEHLFTRNSDHIKAYGIWTPRLWPVRWEDVLQGKHPDLVRSWRKKERSMATPARLTKEDNEPLVQLNDGELSYGSRTVWKNINLSIHRGDWIAVMGPNGSGKSSLLKVLMGIQRLTKGDLHYSFLAQRWRRPDTDQLSAHVGFVFQNPEHQFITDTVYDEVAFSGKLAEWPADELHRKVEQLLHDFGLDPLRDAHPFTLSTGQQRRLSVASMLLDQRQLLLLDEPTFGQDARTTAELMKRLEQLNMNGTTIVMATHDVELAYHYSTEVIILADESIVFSGAPDELLEREHEWRHAHLRLPLYLDYIRRLRQAEPSPEVTLT